MPTLEAAVWYWVTIRRLVQVLFATLSTLALVSAVLITLAGVRRRRLVELEEQRFRSYQLADQLRHSSDELTRFARTYVVTADPKYARYYEDVLDIRSGKQPLPQRYMGTYWDLFIDRGSPVGDVGPAVSLTQRMVLAGFSPAEMDVLGRALSVSDSLVAIEETAMHAVRGQFRDAAGSFTRTGPRNQALAIRIMHDSTYHHQKARIMAPIDSFLTAVEVRTNDELATFKAQTAVAFVTIESIFLVFVLLVLFSYPLLQARILTPVGALQIQTRGVATDIQHLADVSTKISQGDLAQSFAVSTAPVGSRRPDEIGELSRLHDSMLGELQSTGGAVAAITGDMKHANAALHELERLRDELVHMIVHDMRSPLTVLLGQLQVIQMDASGEMADSVKDAMRGARALNQLANEVLDVSRLEQGKMPLQRTPTDVPALARGVAKAMSALEPDRRIEVVATFAALSACDAGLIHRVLENLVSNAIKHSPRGGAVVITVTAAANRVRVAVQDEGAGVPEAARARIFEKFGAASARKDSQYHSVGLGLAFCKLAVEAHGGTIRVEDAVPRGSAFVFELPA